MAEDVTQLDWHLDPLQVLTRWTPDQPVALLHSGRHHSRWAHSSIMAPARGGVRFLSEPGPSRIETWGQLPGDLANQLAQHNTEARAPFADLRRVLAAHEGPWVGYLSYDLGRWIEQLPRLASDDRHWPSFELLWCPDYLVCQTQTNHWTAHGDWQITPLPDLPKAEPQNGRFTTQSPQSVFTPEAYRAAVQRVIDYIAAGDAFQVNLAQRFTAHLEVHGQAGCRAVFDRLAQVSPAWYGAYLELPASADQPAGDWRYLASTSPELFLEVNGNKIVTRPIKGTRPASVPADELLHSAKDQAELYMIVDLLRNDLGRVARYGSVRVTQPREIESHPTVHHGTATIEATLREGCDVVDLLYATMPGGSITGAPKVRAMEIIEELEPVRRGPYCGAIGYFHGSKATLNIAIRTMQITPSPQHATTPDTTHHRVDFSVGGGIVADSNPASEYQETLDKAAAILKALGAT